MIRHLIHQLRRQDGAYTVIGLMFIIGFVVPAIIVLQNISFAANASSQAEGMAYNLSYTAANRAIDHAATNNADQVQLLQINRDDPSLPKVDDVYLEMIQARSRMEEASSNGGNSNTTYEFETFPNTRAYGVTTTGVPRVAGLTNVSTSPSAARALNGGPSCPATEGHARYLDGNGPVLLCWQDGRGALAAETLPDTSSWAHFSSGAQINLRARTPQMLMPDFDTLRIGVATFGRPCETATLACSGGQ